ncbi:FAD-dependent thymidylate synthase [Castellaniella sp.]|uniref:FAD-dependent thymidylate synthase n=1 Tax=Castellaniella sp. TaxID=1955812 RepID=UPI002AFFB817|nr:FAD-dependent thymidylate synthase [Castellaniella sp.]
MIQANVIADSISGDDVRLTTLQLQYPRFIHGELMTHRVFSRNASSSRAIPVARMIRQVEDDPAFFVHIGKNQPGMQAREAVDERTAKVFEREWRELAKISGDFATRWSKHLGIHKQCVNRVLEPFQWMNTIVTATDWENFFELRCHPDAQPEMQALANVIKDAMWRSAPVELTQDQWHLPYVFAGNDVNESGYNFELARKCSVARCARVSYANHDGSEPDIEKDVALFDKLVGSRPLHASPAEHQATPDRKLKNGRWAHPELHGNLTGWIQFRKQLEQQIWKK